MRHFSLWKILFAISVSVAFIWLSLPTLLPPHLAEKIPAALTANKINLGLDLRGGSQLLLELDFDAYMAEQLENLRFDIRSELREKKIGYLNFRTEHQTVIFDVRPDTVPEDTSVTGLLRRIGEGLEASQSGDTVTVGFDPQGLQRKKMQLIEQTIEIINRRVNETGTTEPIIQRQGSDRILLQVPGLSDPEQLKRILGKTAKMTFHLVNLQVSAQDMLTGHVPLGTRVLPGDDKDRGMDGQPRRYAVFSKVELSGDQLTGASVTYDQGEPVVAFKFNTVGARKFGEITSKNVGKPFAVVLDGKVITAPRINQPILGGSGIISGNFTVESANDLALLLRAGALPAPIKIVEERTVGPSMGADSIDAGARASIIGVIMVMVFVFLAYGLFGVFANLALVVNLFLILGGLALLQATLTMPGIAGIVLTLGMAVDANVLIFERMREEAMRGRTAYSAVEKGFEAALGTIVDSNLTTLIAAAVLYAFGTGTIRGFAVTLSIGIVASMFSAILLTRLMVYAWLSRVKVKRIPL